MFRGMACAGVEGKWYEFLEKQGFVYWKVMGLGVCGWWGLAGQTCGLNCGLTCNKK